MRIKRFHAPDMRTALRMVRDEQGPDAVILSNRATADGIEVVAATDYDESLMSQALRAAAPGIETTPVPAARTAPQGTVQAHASPAAGMRAASVPAASHAAPDMAAAAARGVIASTRSRSVETASVEKARVETARVETARVETARVETARVEAAPARVAARFATSVPAQAEGAAALAGHREPARESLISRARAIFRIGDAPAGEGPTLAELVTPPLPTFAAAPATPGRRLDIKVDDTIEPENCLSEAAPADVVQAEAAAAEVAQAAEPVPEATFEALIAGFQAPVAAPATEPAIDAIPMPEATIEASPYAQSSDADYLIALSTPGTVAAAPVATPVASPRMLQAVPAPRVAVADPSIAAMREELASMRALMERQLETLSLERLRGSPARAAALDALLGFGCDDALAQSIAAAIDPRLAGTELQAALSAQFAQAIPALRAEPIDDGGVIALVGPTGAGKTTVAAKLAARFAARHRARDVALVSIDRERTGAREQLHAYGRRLGVTVCDAESADELGHALDQLADYPLVLVDTTGYGVRDRALLRQILWLRSSSRLRSLLVLPANANPHDLAEIARRYRPAAPQGVVLTKLDETGRAGAALSVLAQQGLPLAYTSAGQQIPQDLQAADAAALAPGLAPPLEKTARAAVNPLAIEDRHAFA